MKQNKFKHIKHSLPLWGGLVGLLSLSSCADNDPLGFLFAEPGTLSQYDYLRDYDVLKNYVDRSANPDFHLTTAVNAEAYNELGNVFAVANTNFDEIVTGNAFKMGSCINDKGDMNLTTVMDLVKNAEATGVSVFGHTLAWHSQQSKKWLDGLLAGHEIKVDPNEKVPTIDREMDYSTMSSFPFYVMGYTPTFEDGCMVSEYPGGWYQYFAADGIPTEAGSTYYITATIKGSEAGSINVNMGDWSGATSATLSYGTEFKDVTIEMKNVPATSSFVVFQPGTQPGKIWIKNLKVYHMAAPVLEWWADGVTNPDCEGDDASCYFETVGKKGPSAAHFSADGEGAGGTGRCVKVQATEMVTAAWDNQFFLKIDHEFLAGAKYHVSFDYRADKPAHASMQAHNNPGGYLHWTFAGGGMDFTTEWQHFDYEGDVPAEADGAHTIAFNLSEFAEANNYYFDNIHFEYKESGNRIPLTDEEKKDTLTWAMNRWIDGIMKVCEGRVKAWDVVNEPISGADLDNDGINDLQSATRGTAFENDIPTCFYWQDYLGDLDYVRTAVALARKSFAEHEGNAAELKLFVNDYGLEGSTLYDSDLKKCKSLIAWVGKWEEDNVTKIDGIGTQMHVSVSMDPAEQQLREQRIAQMFELLAATGKLVRVSELDMGIDDADGNEVTTVNATEEQLKAQARFYNFIVRAYMEKVPAAQRYGICAWGLTDSPAGSGWRAGLPIGLWTEQFYRKHAYGGFADGLKGVDYEH